MGERTNHPLWETTALENIAQRHEATVAEVARGAAGTLNATDAPWALARPFYVISEQGHISHPADTAQEALSRFNEASVSQPLTAFRVVRLAIIEEYRAVSSLVKVDR